MDGTRGVALLHAEQQATNATPTTVDQAETTSEPQEDSEPELEAVERMTVSPSANESTAAACLPEALSSEQAFSGAGGGITVDTCDRRGEDGKLLHKTTVCLFCRKELVKFAPHLERCHGNEEIVQQITALEKNSKERRNLCLKVQNQGNFAHNIDVLKAGKGILKVVRRPDSQATCKSYKDYIPCPCCSGFHFKHDLWRHLKSLCPFREGRRIEEAKAVTLGKDILAFSLCDEEEEEICLLLNSMKDQSLREVIKSDWLLKKFAKTSREEYASAPVIRERLQTLARVFVLVKEDVPECALLQCANLLDTAFFDHIVAAVRKTNNANGPVLRQQLEKCSHILLSEALRRHDDAMKSRAMDFIELIDLEWDASVAKPVHTQMHLNKFDRSSPRYEQPPPASKKLAAIAASHLISPRQRPSTKKRVVPKKRPPPSETQQPSEQEKPSTSQPPVAVAKSGSALFSTSLASLIAYGGDTTSASEDEDAEPPPAAKKGKFDINSTDY